MITSRGGICDVLVNTSYVPNHPDGYLQGRVSVDELGSTLSAARHLRVFNYISPIVG